jgi:hypothetical protein
MTDEYTTDDLPSPPLASQPIDDTLDPTLLTDVPKMGEAIPVGTYAFRLDSFTENWTTKDYKTNQELAPEEQQPYYALQWKCQQEPHVGRVVFENVPWVRREDTKAASNPSDPRRADARKILNNRLPRAKEIMEAAGFTPSAGMSFKQFLQTNPEIKLQLKLKERQSKGQDGKWHGTGDWQNEVQKHISLHRPA